MNPDEPISGQESQGNLSAQEAYGIVYKILEESEIYQGSNMRSWPDSVYFGRYRSDFLQIRVSDHKKPYAPSKREIDIILRDGMTIQEIQTITQDAIDTLTVEENILAKEEGFD